MIHPIHIIGSPVLRKTAKDIDKDYPELEQLISDMLESMDSSSGVGLAAPQIGFSIRLFTIDTEPMQDDEDEDEKEEIPLIKKTFINAHIIERSGDIMTYDEGCLSIPGLREEVDREDKILIRYQDENFNSHEETYEGIVARIIQHEYDHLEGILFTDHLSVLRKRLLKKKLTNISKGIFDANYKFKLGNVTKKKRR